MILMWLCALSLGPAVLVLLYLIERGPIIGSRWLDFLRDLRNFRDGR